jgi:WD40 repeat protein
MLLSAQTKYLVTGAADNTMRLWDVRSGKCLYVWEFLTAVKRVAWRWVRIRDDSFNSFHVPRLAVTSESLPRLDGLSARESKNRSLDWRKDMRRCAEGRAARS